MSAEPRGVKGDPYLVPDDKTLDEVESLGRVQLSLRECGSFFGVSHITFENFLNTHEKAREAYERGLGEGKARIRRKQIQRALEDGSDTMLIWLGKQYLEQKDKSELGGVDGGPVLAVINVSTTTSNPSGSA